MSDPLFARYGKSARVGEVLFKEGDEGVEMFVVRKGSIRVFVTANNMEKTLAILGPGEFVGEMSLLTGESRTATAVIHEDAELLVVGSQVLEDMIVQNTEIALRLIRKLARRLQSTNTLVQVLLYRDSKERVIENLKRLATLHGWTEGNNVTLQADYEGVAEQIGLEMTEVHDVISRLIRAGALVEKDGTWTIENPDKLHEFLKFLKLKEQFQ
jgi:CRP/FNR family cyclic AMP-dependent transcriptional regulator